ncbi:MAG: cell division protein FtsQ/DivIB [Bacteroidia bacterium]
MSATIINTPKKARQNRPLEETKSRTRAKKPSSGRSWFRGPLLYVLVLAGAGALLAASSLYQSELTCEDIALEMKAETGKQLLSMAEVKETLGITTGSEYLGQPMGSINLKAMEAKLAANPSVESVQVFHRLNGVLYIDLEARTPIARVSGVDESFYVDANGMKFPLSKHYAPNVPLVRGVLDENLAPADTLGCVLEELMPLIRHVNKDKFWNAQVSEIRRRQDGTIMLYPEIGNFPMVLGDSDNLDNKFQRLFAFYEQVVRKHGWEKYKQVSVAYNGQVVAKKN